jgi:kynurenine 3-monooxygenase
VTPVDVTIAGAGPTGALLAILLRRRGLSVRIFESRDDARGKPAESGRSINLAMADRGINALHKVGVFADIAQDLIPMVGRLVHDASGVTSLQTYGGRANEVIYSISRHRLNEALLDVAMRRFGVDVRFEHRLESADFSRGVAEFHDRRQGLKVTVPMHPLLACDGAGSRMRRELHRAGLITASETPLDHGYKELTIPANPDGGHRLLREALHVWPRGNYMMIALPNMDGSFTATLFLANAGSPSFASLVDAAAVDAFLVQSFPDAMSLMPDARAEFQTHPTGFLGTVHAGPWHAHGTAAIIGDAAHAIVPFHGQGMNCCFEDCVALDACLGRSGSWERALDEFYRIRKPNTDAIATMAIENYLEMRAHVADGRFRLRHALSLELERRFPDRFIPRYSMVMFHAEIPYALAQERGLIQSRLLEDLTAGAEALGDVDYGRAAREITAQLAPIATATAQEQAPAQTAPTDDTRSSVRNE